MYHQFNIQQLYALPTLLLCVLYLPQYKQLLVPLTAKIDCFCNMNLNLCNSTGRYMYQNFKIQQMYALPTLHIFVSYLSENKQRLIPLTA